VNDNAPVIPAGQVFSVSEAAANGTGLGAVMFSDVDLPGDTLSVSIVAGNNAGVFSIDNAGNLIVADNSNLDFESTSTYGLTVRVFDGVNLTDQIVTVNVLDVEETKFYVVNDASTNRTYEYDADGTTIEDYTLNSGNSAPRGVASTVTGDRVWVIDANRTVYIYDTSGELLGTWTAGSMSSSATPEGIATDGIDIWIVDARSDRVYKYTGAATRVSGSQSAASSFNLDSGNRSPKDIVTDGTSLWVVNDAGTNKVFKYSVAGSLQGSWTIDSENSSPRGLTIDPANVSDIWIVDSSTDRVYQYTGAATRTSGSQSASATFDLATGNSNPQGIADPPEIESVACGSAEILDEPLAIAEVVFDSELPTRPVRPPARKSIPFAARDEAFERFLATRTSPASRPMYQRTFTENMGADSNWPPSEDSGQAAVALALESALDNLLERALHAR
jgi:hypothetical protein